MLLTVATTPEDWMDVRINTELAEQAAGADAAKVIVAFTTGVAAALIAPALEEAGPLDWLKAAAALSLIVALGLAVWVFLADQLEQPDHRAVTTAHHQRPEATREELLYQLRLSAQTAVNINGPLVRRMRVWGRAQVAVAVLSCALSIASLAR